MYALEAAEVRSGEGVEVSWGLWGVHPLRQNSVVPVMGSETMVAIKQQDLHHLQPNIDRFRIREMDRHLRITHLAFSYETSWSGGVSHSALGCNLRTRKAGQ